MKCPECKKIFSDLRDICPKCFIDLREQKNKQNIKITYPAASYDDLLIKYKHKPKSPINTHDLIGSGISKLIHALSDEESHLEKEQQAIKAPRCKEEERPQTWTHKEDPPELKNWNVSNWLSEIDTQIEAKEKTAKINLHEEDKNKEQFSVWVSDQIAESRTEKNDSLLTKDESLSTLWIEARKELSAVEEPVAIEFSSSSFTDLTKREDIKILFDIARSAIANPEIEGVYDESAKALKEEKIEESTKLQTVLKNTTNKVEKQVYTLKKKTPAIEDSQPSNETYYVTLAPMLKRGIAFTLDISTIGLLSIIVAAAITQLQQPEIVANLLLDFRYNYEMIIILEKALPIFVLVAFCYQLSALLLFNNTLGLSLTNLRILSPNGKKPTASQIFVRVATMPLSFLCAWLIPLRAQHQPLHDTTSKTITCIK